KQCVIFAASELSVETLGYVHHQAGISGIVHLHQYVMELCTAGYIHLLAINAQLMPVRIRARRQAPNVALRDEKIYDRLAHGLADTVYTVDVILLLNMLHFSVVSQRFEVLPFYQTIATLSIALPLEMMGKPGWIDLI